jgi:hypothetical protein
LGSSGSLENDREHTMPSRTMRSNTTLSVEPLEGRRLLATLVSPKIVTYRDVDGDDVTVTFSRGVLSPARVASIVEFNNAFPTSGQQLRRLRFDLIGLDGVGVTVTAKPSAAGGDGLAHVGMIDASGVRLGNVVVRGDLGRVVAGSADSSAKAIQSLTVGSIGLFGTSTQGPGGSTESVLTGGVGVFVVKNGVTDATVSVERNDGGFGSVGRLEIGSVRSSTIEVGACARVTIKGDVSDSDLFVLKAEAMKIGGSFLDSEISGSNVKRLTIDGDVVGGSAANSGEISFGSLDVVHVKGSIRGGSGFGSGVVAAASLGAITIGGNLVGGSGDKSGTVRGTRIGTVRVKQSILSAEGALSGSIQSRNAIKDVFVAGSLSGSADRRVVIAARGQQNPSTAADLAIRSLRIGGDVRFADILAGQVLDVDDAGSVVIDIANGDASIGSIVVLGTWEASNVSAGIGPLFGNNYGDGLDIVLTTGGSPDRVAAIDSIRIEGDVLGTSAGGDHFGFVAQFIRTFVQNGRKAPLSAAVRDNLALGITNDVRVREVG